MAVVVLAGPSGSGKSRVSARSGLPVLHLDDFYRDQDDPALPQSSLGLPDWDDPRSWDRKAALAAIEALCQTGSADVPSYDIGRSKRIGSTTVTLAAPGARFIAEGLFATHIIDDCRDAGFLDAALCVRHHRLVTFLLRLARDLRESRKPAGVLLRRGWRLMRAEPSIVADALAHGCIPVTPRQAEKFLATN